jgi:competence CoiA-like predicted nuclease
MNFAKDLITGQRISASRGAHGVCEICKGKVTAFCGDVLIWHFKHDKEESCDPWHEGETEWHRQWKSHFPEETREVVIRNSSEEHRADIKIHDIVIEFQNSPISSGDIALRERFYGDMVWVINAIDIRDNFELQSVAERKAKVAREDLHKVDPHRETFEQYKSLSSLERSVQISENENRESLLQKNYLEKRCSVLLEFVNDLDSLIAALEINFTKSVLFQFQDEKPFRYIREKYSASYLKLQEEKAHCINSQQRLHQINNSYKAAKTVEIGGKLFKLLTTTKVTGETLNQFQVYYIREDEVSILFKTPMPVLDEFQLARLKGQTRFLYLLDHEETKTKLIQQQSEMQSRLVDNEVKFKEFYSTLRNECYQLLKQEISYLNPLLEESKARYQKSTEEVNLNRTLYSSYRDEVKQLNRNRYLNEVESYHNTILHAQTSYENEFYYKWKHRRKSWDDARKTIYFDFGIAVYQLLSSGKLYYFSRQEFIKKMLSGNLPIDID